MFIFAHFHGRKKYWEVGPLFVDWSIALPVLKTLVRLLPASMSSPAFSPYSHCMRLNTIEL